jgi:leucyl-tRNA synthetase
VADKADRYDFHSLEPKWQRRWAERGLFRTVVSAERPKFYYLDMFPYPSGDLHMGHVRNYIIGDVLARYWHMRGFNVMHPMGWDAFGLPAENAAIQRGIHPAIWTRTSSAKMKEQFDALGITYDWAREVDASRPDYYKWTQWLFLQLYHAGLAYRGEASVNWCNSCQTVLAREELEGTVCERCHTPVEIRRTPGQWFLAITRYAERLLEDIALLDKWPERVRVMQENWIGRSTGVQFRLPLENREDQIEVFTTRIDTIYGITFMALAAEHPLVKELTAGTEYEQPVAEFVRQASLENATDREAATEKKGMFLGAYCLHPLTGARVPLYVTNYVLMEYGTGAVMAVPAHDQRDLEFAREYGIPVRVVIVPEPHPLPPPLAGEGVGTEAYVAPGFMVNSGAYDGMPSSQFKEAIGDYLEAEGIGERQVHYRLHDWLISRQRYWGCPIPMVTCAQCGDVAVPEEQLPVLLPEKADFTPTGDSPLARVPEFVNTTCPQCGGPPRPETDTMTTFVDSSWYYLRYASPDADQVPFRREEVDYWLPVDKYVGGVEHAVRHLLYSRFITKVLYDLGHIGFSEPFRELFTQGMIYIDGHKMSKRGRVVRPEEISDTYGTDTGRTFILFVGPPEQDAEWSDHGVEGCHRFLQRVWRVVVANEGLWLAEWKEILGVASPVGAALAPPAPAASLTDAARALRRKTHQTIRAVTDCIADMRLNTMISAMMELTNELIPFAGQLTPEDLAGRAAFSEGVALLLHLLSPTAPHLCDELWERLGEAGSVYEQPWPSYDPAIAAAEQITIVVQINSKVRDRLEVPADTPMAEIEKLALALPAIQKQVEGKTVRKVIAVEGKLVNFVVS